MKKLLILAMCFLSLHVVNAQKLKLGAKVGMGSSSVKAQDLFVTSGNDVEDLKLNFQSSKPAYQAGVFARMSLLGLYIQPEALLTFASASYAEAYTGNSSQTIHNERLVYLDVPVTAGLKLAFLRVYGGPVFSTLISSSSDLSDIEGLNRNFNESSLLGQIGTGLDLGKLTLDVKYEFNIGGDRDQVNFLGNSYDLSKRKSQAIVSLGYVF